jgi:hypothetical protein
MRLSIELKAAAANLMPLNRILPLIGGSLCHGFFPPVRLVKALWPEEDPMSVIFTICKTP